MIKHTATVYGLNTDPKASVRAVIEFKNLGLTLRCEDGDAREGFLAYQGMQASLCGAEQNVWMLKSQDSPYIVCIEDPQTKQALGDFVPDELKTSILELERRESRANYILNLFFILPVVFVVFLFAVGLYVAMAILRKLLLGGA